MDAYRGTQGQGQQAKSGTTTRDKHSEREPTRMEAIMQLPWRPGLRRPQGMTFA